MGLMTDIRLIKLYFKVKPLLDQLEGVFKVKFSFNSIVQIVGIVGQIFNVVGGFVPSKYQGLIAGILAGVQGVTGAVAHFKNPDGTPATTPYVPGSGK